MCNYVIYIVIHISPYRSCAIKQKLNYNYYKCNHINGYISIDVISKRTMTITTLKISCVFLSFTKIN